MIEFVFICPHKVGTVDRKCTTGFDTFIKRPRPLAVVKLFTKLLEEWLLIKAMSCLSAAMLYRRQSSGFTIINQ